jgi:YD repeat-containing protein
VGAPGYDANGNTLTDEWGHGYSYDAWNRLAQVTLSSSTIVYTYDALGRRLAESGGLGRDLYYSKDWQVLEERLGGLMQYQQVWSPVYVDALVLRDGGLSGRLYVQQDANWKQDARTIDPFAGERLTRVLREEELGVGQQERRPFRLRPNDEVVRKELDR